MKHYVVWIGKVPGVYSSWDECKEQVHNFSGAKFKSFKTKAEAEQAFAAGAAAHSKAVGGTAAKVAPKASPAKSQAAKSRKPVTELVQVEGKPRPQFGLAVDAACNKNPGGDVEYRGVDLATGQEIFHSPIYNFGTNNVGEFLAIVHGLALLKKQGLEDMPLYSDSRNAILWVKAGKCRTNLERNEKNVQLFERIAAAEKWLAENRASVKHVNKWFTEHWGEVPADFGRK